MRCCNCSWFLAALISAFMPSLGMAVAQPKQSLPVVVWPSLNESLASALELSPAQQSQWDALQLEFMQYIENESFLDNPEDYKQKVAETYEQMYDILTPSQIATAKQFESLRGWRLKNHGKVDARIFLLEEVQKLLVLDEDQVSFVKGLLEEMEKQLEDTKISSANESLALKEETEEKLEKLLSPGQHSSFNDLIGKPFEFDAKEVKSAKSSFARFGRLPRPGFEITHEVENITPLLTVAPATSFDHPFSIPALLKLAQLECVRNELDLTMAQENEIAELAKPVFAELKDIVGFKVDSQYLSKPTWTIKQKSGELKTVVFLDGDAVLQGKLERILNNKQAKRLREIYWQWLIDIKGDLPLLHGGWEPRLKFTVEQRKEMRSIREQYVAELLKTRRMLSEKEKELRLESIASALDKLNEVQLQKWQTLTGPFYQGKGLIGG